MVYGFKELVTDSRTGLNPRRNFVLGNGDNYYITIKDIYNGKINFSDKTDKVDDAAIQIIKRRSRIKIGDVLFVSIGRIGETAIVAEKDDSWDVNESVFVFSLNMDIIIPEYFCILFQSDAVRQYLIGNSSGSTFKSIKMNQLEKMTFDLPPIEQQRQIAMVLSAIKGLIASRKDQLLALDTLIKARFVELFGDSKVNPYGFNKVRLKDSCEIVTGNTPSRTVDDYYGDYIEWIKTDNIMAEMMYPTRATESLSEVGLKVGRYVEKGAILMACIAGSVASIGKVCITDRQVAFNQQINAIVPKKYNALFLYVLLQTSKDYLVEELNMALKGILSKSKLGEKTFILPPMDQQNDFAAFVAQIDKSKAVVQAAHVIARNLHSRRQQKCRILNF